MKSLCTLFSHLKATLNLVKVIQRSSFIYSLATFPDATCKKNIVLWLFEINILTRLQTLQGYNFDKRDKLGL